jgi:hypothetical protein
LDTLTLEDVAQVHRLSPRERQEAAQSLIDELRAIPTAPGVREARDRAGIAQRGNGIYDKAIAARPRTAMELASARFVLRDLGASLNLLDALERAEITR